MTLFYADASALARAYLADEPGHDELRTLLLAGEQRVVTSEVSRIELASAVHAAGRARRSRSWERLLARIEVNFRPGGPTELLELRPAVVLDRCYRLVVDYGLRTLDALHLAVALEECPALDDDIVFVTRDADQASAAAAIGLALA